MALPASSKAAALSASPCLRLLPRGHSRLSQLCAPSLSPTYNLKLACCVASAARRAACSLVVCHSARSELYSSRCLLLLLRPEQTASPLLAVQRRPLSCMAARMPWAQFTADCCRSAGTPHAVQHTSASLTINENADPDVRADMETFFNKARPVVLLHLCR